MNTATRVGAFGAGLLVTFGAALGAGRLVGPFDPVGAPLPHTAMEQGHATSGAPTGTHGTDSGNDHAGTAASSPLPAGLSATDRGHRLVLTATTVAAKTGARVAFRILGPDGQPVTRYATAHEKKLHLIVVRRDLSGFQHVHPTMAPDGTWSAPLDLSRPGQWRVLADFDPEGDTPGLVLGTDLAVPGTYTPVALPGPDPGSSAGAFTLRATGALSPGRSQPVAFTVARTDAGPVQLEPYLGAGAHLVVLREGDLAYAHAHPVTEVSQLGGGTEGLAFEVETPGPGRYRMFLDFKVAGTVHTAAFTADAGRTTP